MSELLAAEYGVDEIVEVLLELRAILLLERAGAASSAPHSTDMFQHFTHFQGLADVVFAEDAPAVAEGSGPFSAASAESVSAAAVDSALFGEIVWPSKPRP